MRLSLRATWLVALLVALLLVIAVVPAAQASPATGLSGGYSYRVRPGDSWSSISRQTGIPVRALQAANPQAVRPPQYWLYVGEVLWIPAGGGGGGTPPPGCGYWYTVRAGDTLSGIARATGVSAHAIAAANPGKVRPPNYWVYAGQRLWIPCGGAPPPPPPPSSECIAYYTVQPGNSWSSIAASYGISVHALQTANPGKVRPPSYVIYAGESLCIPDS